MIREVAEETGYSLDPEHVHHIATLYIRVPNFDFQYHMFDYLQEINIPGEVKINFAEHKGFTWVTPQDALNMNLITDEDVCIEITFGLTRIRTKCISGCTLLSKATIFVYFSNTKKF